MTATTPPPSGLSIQQEIRWGDMDAMGHVNNAVYFQYCESARIAYLELLDAAAYRQHPRQDLGMVSASLNFRRQLHYPGSVSVRVNTTKIGNRSFTLRYVITDDASGAVAADGESVCVWVDYDQGRALPLPERMTQRIAEVENNPGLLSERPTNA